MTYDHEILARLEAVEARQACEQLVWAYAQAFDRREERLMRSIWSDDAVLILGEPFGDSVGIEAIMETVHRLWRKTPRMHHWMSNPLIQIDGDAATGISALDAFMLDSESGPTQVSGEYEDRFERRHGRWVITHRVFALHFWTPIPGWKPEAGENLEYVTPVA
jgi:hypothetical protein